MKNKKFIITILLLLSVELMAGQTIKSFNSDWKFKLHQQEGAQTPDFDDSDWESVIVPHDASIGGKFDHDNSTSANGWLPHQEGWYRKSFTIPATAKGKKMFIKFEGVYRDAKVWFNGEYLGRNLNGYLGFEYDLTPYVKFDEENVIAVHYDNTIKGTSRWYTGEGIYRDVWLKTVNPVYVPDMGIHITTPFITNELARVSIHTKIVNDTEEPGEIIIETEIVDPTGNTVTSKKAVVYLQYLKDYTFHQQLEVKNPALWDTKNPNLYHAKTTVYFNGEIQDKYLTRFGIRDIQLTADEGLLLNGKKVFAQGGNIHHDLGCVGAVALKSGYRYRLQKLKEMGCNSLRLSHNPHAPVLLDLCDEMGILVISEAYDKWTSQYYGGEVPFKKVWKDDLEKFIKRDRNHPSVYLWSVGNEVPQQLGDFDKKFETKGDAADFGAALLREMVEFTHSIDPSREVTAALFPAREGTQTEWTNWNNHAEFMQTMPPPMAFQMDVVSWNYTGNLFGVDHKNYPQMKFVASEASTNLDFGNRKISMLEFDREHVIGHYYWTALTYLGESSWPSKSWQRAFFDANEQMTPIGYLYKSLYSDEPMVKIEVKEPDTTKLNYWDKQYPNKRWSWYPMLDHWNFEKDAKLEVQAFSNCDEVELILNDISLGSKKIKEGEEPVLYWNVPYQKGMLVAVGKQNGKVVTKDTLKTSGKPKKIVLTPHTKSLKANGGDLVYIQVSLQDKNGNIVPVDKLISFKVEGAATIAGVANSNEFSDEPWQNNKRTTVNGKCLIVLRTTNDNGKIEITANTKGVKSTKLELSSK